MITGQTGLVHSVSVKGACHVFHSLNLQLSGLTFFLFLNAEKSCFNSNVKASFDLLFALNEFKVKSQTWKAIKVPMYFLTSSENTGLILGKSGTISKLKLTK